MVRKRVLPLLFAVVLPLTETKQYVLLGMSLELNKSEELKYLHLWPETNSAISRDA
jgi:hypothetical protein